jgi:hypothetical protein
VDDSVWSVVGAQIGPLSSLIKSTSFSRRLVVIAFRLHPWKMLRIYVSCRLHVVRFVGACCSESSCIEIISCMLARAIELSPNLASRPGRSFSIYVETHCTAKSLCYLLLAFTSCIRRQMFTVLTR